METARLEPRDFPLHLTLTCVAAHLFLVTELCTEVDEKGGTLLEHGMLWMILHPSSCSKAMSGLYMKSINLMLLNP